MFNVFMNYDFLRFVFQSTRFKSSSQVILDFFSSKIYLTPEGALSPEECILQIIVISKLIFNKNRLKSTHHSNKSQETHKIWEILLKYI